MRGVEKIEGTVYRIDKSVIREMQRRAKLEGVVWVPKVDTNTVCYELKRRVRFNPDTCVVYMEYDTMVVQSLSCIYENYSNVIIVLGNVTNGKLYNRYVSRIKEQAPEAKVFPRALSELKLDYLRGGLYDVFVFGAIKEWVADKDLGNMSTTFMYGWQYTKSYYNYTALYHGDVSNIIVYDEDEEIKDLKSRGLNVPVYPMVGVYSFVYDYED